VLADPPLERPEKQVDLGEQGAEHPPGQGRPLDDLPAYVLELGAPERVQEPADAGRRLERVHQPVLREPGEERRHGPGDLAGDAGGRVVLVDEPSLFGQRKAGGDLAGDGADREPAPPGVGGDGAAVLGGECAGGLLGDEAHGEEVGRGALGDGPQLGELVHGRVRGLDAGEQRPEVLVDGGDEHRAVPGEERVEVGGGDARGEPGPDERDDGVEQALGGVAHAALRFCAAAWTAWANRFASA
jgi:hypothetical protein